jgi:hypothetical protein
LPALAGADFGTLLDLVARGVADMAACKQQQFTRA